MSASSFLPPVDAWALLLQEEGEGSRLSLGCAALDELLDGGLRVGVTELVGEAGACKSQLAFQLLLQVQLPLPPPRPHPTTVDSAAYGLDGCGLYLSTEGAAPMGRLLQLQEGMRRRLPWTSTYDYLDCLYVEQCRSVEELQLTLTRLPSRIAQHRIRLVVIDSIAGLFRLEDPTTPHHHPVRWPTAAAHSPSTSPPSLSSSRADALFSISAELRRLSHLHHLIVLVCNQVTDRFEPKEFDACDSLSLSRPSSPSTPQQPSASLSQRRSADSQTERWAMESSGRRVVPALGLTWANCVNCRIGLTRRGGGRGGRAAVKGAAHTQHSGSSEEWGVGGGGGGGGGGAAAELTRKVEVLFAPNLPQRRMQFEVDAEGARGVAGSLEELQEDGYRWVRRSVADGASSGSAKPTSSAGVQQQRQQQERAPLAVLDPNALSIHR